MADLHEKERLRKKKWRKEKEAEESKTLIREAEKAERKEKQRMLEDRWKMVRWLAEFIDKNTNKWGEKEGQKMDLERWKTLGQEEKKKIILEMHGLRQKSTPVLEQGPPQNTHLANAEKTSFLLQQSDAMPRTTKRSDPGPS